MFGPLRHLVGRGISAPREGGADIFDLWSEALVPGRAIDADLVGRACFGHGQQPVLMAGPDRRFFAGLP